MANPVSRILLFQLVGPIERAKYYAIWTLTEVYIALPFSEYSIYLIHSSIPSGCQYPHRFRFYRPRC